MTALLTKILLATDGSEDAALAVRIAAGLAGKTGAELHVTSVGGYHASPYYPPKTPEQGRQEAKGMLDEQVRRIEASGNEVAGTHIRVGSPDEEIVAVAEDVGADLIVMGSRGLGGIRRALMGSVSNSVVHHAHCPVLIARGGDRWEQEELFAGNVLVATDGSREARAAIRLASGLAGATGSRLHLAHVLQVEPPVLYPSPYGTGAEELVRRRAEPGARAFLDEHAEEIRSQGGPVPETHLAIGKPEQEIVRLGQELGAGLVVVGSRGLGWVGRALMGSVSDSVVRHAHGPVLVVRDGEGAERSVPEAGARQGAV